MTAREYGRRLFREGQAERWRARNLEAGSPWFRTRARTNLFIVAIMSMLLRRELSRAKKKGLRMSSVNAVGSNPAIYQAAIKAAAPAKQQAPAPVTTTAGHDPDHDGDKDGPGLDVNG